MIMGTQFMSCQMALFPSQTLVALHNSLLICFALSLIYLLGDMPPSSGFQVNQGISSAAKLKLLECDPVVPIKIRRLDPVLNLIIRMLISGELISTTLITLDFSNINVTSWIPRRSLRSLHPFLAS